MTIINNKYDEKEVKNAIEKALSDFYNALLVLFIIKNENLMADEKSCNSMLYIEESRLV